MDPHAHRARRPAIKVALLLGSLLFALGSTGCARVLPSIVGVREIRGSDLVAVLQAPEPPLVVDVRDEDRFNAGHVPGAISLRLGEIDGYLAYLGPPRARPVRTVCNRGRMSLAAAAIVAANGYLDVASVAGGMQLWQAEGLPQSTGPWRRPAPAALAAPTAAATFWQQLALVIAAFGVKPAYMLLSLVLIMWLRTVRSRDLALIRWSLVFFLAGETLCAANYVFAGGQLDTLEIGHGAGMMVSNALLPWGLFVLLDSRVLRLTDIEAVCVGQRLCGRCFKRDVVACPAHRLMLLIAPALALLALLPWCMPLLPRNLVVPVFGTPVPFTFSLTLQLVEFRAIALLAAACLLVAFVMLLPGASGVRRAEGPFFAGLGMLSFPLLKLFLLQVFRTTPVWSDVWEEVTELLTILAVALFLWVLRRQIGLAKPAESP